MNWSGNQAGEDFEYHLLVIGLATALLINAPGCWSLDAVLGGKYPKGNQFSIYLNSVYEQNAYHCRPSVVKPLKSRWANYRSFSILNTSTRL